MRDFPPRPIESAELLAPLAILGYTTPTGGDATNIFRRDVIANIGDPQAFAEAGKPFFWEDRSGSSKGDAFHVAYVDKNGTWTWEMMWSWGDF
jgi:hypothetical protein